MGADQDTPAHSPSWFARSAALTRQSVSCWREGEGGTGAAEIAFWSAVSLFPAAVAAAGALDQRNGATSAPTG